MNKKDLSDAACSLASSTDADVVILLENGVCRNTMLRALQNKVTADFYIPKSAGDGRFQCFSRKSQLDLSESHSEPRISIRKFLLGNRIMLLTLVHGPDMRNNDSNQRMSFAHQVARQIRFMEVEKRLTNAILIGDLNMNPYESGMNLAAGLNAMMARSCTERRTRRHDGQYYEFYYNPMWSLFGDNTKGPPGTVYDTSKQGPYGWNMLDQVLLHHSVIPLFENVEILTNSGEHSLMNKRGRPDKKKFSDHFPILVRFYGDAHE